MSMRRLFISYVATHPTKGMTFGQMDQEIDFLIRNGDDLTKAVLLGCKRLGLQIGTIVVLNWRFFEE